MVSRMEIVPPSSLAEPVAPPPVISSAAAAASATVGWANFPDGPVLHDDGFGSASASLVKNPPGGTAKRPEMVLPGTGDSYTCCFTAAGDADRPSPLGKLRVTWRPEEDARSSARAVAGCGSSSLSLSPAPAISSSSSPPYSFAEEARGGVRGGVGRAQAVTEFPLPVLSARPPALSARLKAPPHARIGEAFSIR